MRLIDKDALMNKLNIKLNCADCKYKDGFSCNKPIEFVIACEAICSAPIVKTHTTTWLGNYCPYRCQKCGHYSDSKTPYCSWCGRRASNYE